jgi:hypothetical protein
MEIIQNSIQKLKKAGYQVQQKEQNRIQFQVMVCGRFAFDGLFLYDESDSEYPPDVILNGLSCKWKEIQALYEYKNSSSDLLRAVNQMKRIFVKKQLLEMKQLGIHQLDFEINCIPDSTDCFLERREDLIVCWFEMPFDTNENGAIGKVLFEFQVSQTLDFISNVIPTIHWPFDPPFEFKTPKFDREATMIEYMSRMQMSINKKLRRSIHNNLQRELFVTQMISQFKNFVLEYDEIDHLYLSLYIFMSAPSEDQTRNTEDILGAAVVNGIVN